MGRHLPDQLPLHKRQVNAMVVGTVCADLNGAVAQNRVQTLAVLKQIAPARTIADQHQVDMRGGCLGLQSDRRRCERPAQIRAPKLRRPEKLIPPGGVVFHGVVGC